MKTTINLPDLDDTRLLGSALAELLVAGDTVLLSGPVGAGKTELARTIIKTRLHEIGLNEDVPSPTFTIVQTYDLGETQIWHADLYRLTSVDELYELGLEMAFSEDICLVEWPENLGPLWPKDALLVSLEVTGELESQDGRRATLEWSASKWDSIPNLLEILCLSPE